MRPDARNKRGHESDSTEDEDDLAKFREAAVAVTPLPTHPSGRSNGPDNVCVAAPKASHSLHCNETSEKKSLRRDKNMVDENGFPQASAYFTPEFKDFVAKKLSEHMDRTFKEKTVKSPRLPSLSSPSPSPLSSSTRSNPAASSLTTVQDPLPQPEALPTTTHQSPLKSCPELENPSPPGPLDGDSSQRQRHKKVLPGAFTLPSSSSRSDVQSSSPINLSFNNDDSGVRLFSNGPKIRLPPGCWGPFGLPSSQDELVNDDDDDDGHDDDDDDEEEEAEGGERSNLLGKSKLTNSEKKKKKMIMMMTTTTTKKKKKRKKPDLLEAIKRRKTLLEKE
ncbi:uncharacterized protein LOC131888613 isoform X2 [Tigriopus californicus]|nr:uncharacterized protein LOC131888613 isoform X2 [Tigriopus californicus]